MKHASSRDLFTYWNERRGSRIAPERGEIEPAAIRSVLGDSFILSFDTFAGHPFRLAGTRVCALFGQEMKGRAFIDLFGGESRQTIGRLIRIVATEGSAVVAGAFAADVEDARTVDAELLLLPLYHRGRMNVRLLGALVPIEVPYWIGQRALGPLTLGPWRHVTPAVAPLADIFVRVPPGGKSIRGLVVYEGGRKDKVQEAVDDAAD